MYLAISKTSARWVSKMCSNGSAVVVSCSSINVIRHLRRKRRERRSWIFAMVCSTTETGATLWADAIAQMGRCAGF